MRRREFIAGLGVVAAFANAAPAQQPGRVRRIGYLSPAAAFNSVDDAFQERLAQLGWSRNQNITIQYGYISGRQDRVEPLVAEFLGAGLDVLVVWSPSMSLAAKRATAQVPLVCLMGFDPVDIGLVTSMSHPGGNITGVSVLGSLETFGKRLQLLTELVPSLSRVASLVSTEQQGSGGPRERLARAAQILNIELHEFEVKLPSDLEAAIGSARAWGAQALYTYPGGFTFSFAQQINDIANAYRLPTVHSQREGALNGGLIAYAADLAEANRFGATYVDKILKGTPPGILPFMQLTKYDLLINLKTAKALGLNVSPTLLARADEVIE